MLLQKGLLDYKTKKYLPKSNPKYQGLRKGIESYINYFNMKRRHQGIERQKPKNYYLKSIKLSTKNTKLMVQDIGIASTLYIFIKNQSIFSVQFRTSLQQLNF